MRASGVSVAGLLAVMLFLLLPGATKAQDVSVSPANATWETSLGASNVVLDFTVYNNASSSASLEFYCSSTGGLSCGSVTPGSAMISGYGNQAVQVTFDAPLYTTTGAIELTVYSSGQPVGFGQYTVQVRGAVPQVTATISPVTVTIPPSSGSVDFTVTNVGVADGNFTFTCSSETAGPITGCTPPAGVPIAQGASVQVTVGVTASSVGSEVLTLTASTANASEQGWASVTVEAAAGVPDVTAPSVPDSFNVDVETVYRVQFQIRNPAGSVGSGTYDFSCSVNPLDLTAQIEGDCVVDPSTFATLAPDSMTPRDVFLHPAAGWSGSGTVTLQAVLREDNAKQSSGTASVVLYDPQDPPPTLDPPGVSDPGAQTVTIGGVAPVAEFNVTNPNDSPLVVSYSCTPDYTHVTGCSLDHYGDTLDAQLIGGDPVHATITANVGTWVGQGSITLVATGGSGSTTVVVPVTVLGTVTPSVTPDGGSQTGEINQPSSLSFTVTNQGNGGTNYSLACLPATCSVQPSLAAPFGSSQPVTVTYTPTTVGVTTITLTASDGESDSGTITLNVPGKLTVMPVGAGGPAVPLTPLTQDFDVTWTGLSQASFDLVATCTSDPGCIADPAGPIQLQDSTQRVRVSFSAGSSAGVATVKLKATKSGEPAVTDSASVDWTVTNDLQLTVEDANPGLEELRGECLSVAAGSGSIECDDYRVTYPLLPITRMNRVRNTALLYNSATATPRKILGANFRAPTGKLIDSLMVRLYVGGTLADSTMYRDVPESGPPVRVAAEWADASYSGSPILHYEMKVGAFYRGPPVTSDSISALGTFLLVDHGEEFGRGWWPAGYERLKILPTNDTLLWIGGDGSARAYVRTAADTFVAWTRGVPDFITTAPAEASDSAYYLDVDGGEGASITAGVHHNLQGVTQMTWAFWIQSRGYSGRIGGITSGSDPNRVWWFEADNSGSEVRTVLFNAAAGDPVYLNAPGLTPNAWHLVVAQFDGTQSTDATRFRMWIDGNEKSITRIGPSVPTALSSGTASFEWGKISSMSSGFNGLLGEVAIVRGLVSQTERDEWRVGGIDFNHPALAAGYEWNDNLEDVGPYGNHLTSVGIDPADYVSTVDYASRPTPSGGWTGGSALPQPGGYLDLDGSEYGSRAEGTYSGLSGTSQMTWAFWLNPTGEGKVAGIRYYSSADTWSWSIETSRAYGDAIWFVTRDGALNTTLVESAGLNFNQWNFVVIKFDGAQAPANRLRIFINGVDRTTYFNPNASSMPTLLATVTWPFAVGNTSPNYPGLPGKLGEFAMLPGVLSDSTMADWRQDGIDMAYPGLTAAYKWQGNLNDASTSANHLTGVNIDAADYGTDGGYPSRGAGSGGGSGGGGTGSVASYIRHLLGGGEVHYDATGRHIKTVDRNGNETLFGHTVFGTETRLTSIELPTPSGPEPAYKFNYDSTSLSLDLTSLQTLDQGGAWISYPVTTSVSAAGGFLIDRLTAPDGVQTAFGYQPGGEGLLSTVADVRGAETHVSYVTQKVSEIAILTPGDSTIADITMPYLAASIVGTDPTPSSVAGPTEVDSVSAVFDGARSDVADTTRFFLNGWGAVRGIRDAKGYETWVSRENTQYPTLVTTVAYANGRQIASIYGASGLMASVTDNVSSPAGVTLYGWDAKWRRPTLVTSPEAVQSRRAYDAATGNLLWHSVAGDTVRYYYDATGLLDSIQTPEEGAVTRFAYDSLGNAKSETSPLGFTTRWERDARGLPSLSVQPIEGTQNVYVNTFRDVMGREVFRLASNDKDEEWMEVVTTYNPVTKDRVEVKPWGWAPAGQDSTTTGSTTWTHDALGRVRTETAAATDSLVYDGAGNVVKKYRGSRSIGLQLASTMTYDELNLLDTRIVPAKPYGPSGGIDTIPFYSPAGLTISAETQSFSYDEMGNALTANNDFAHITRTYELDGLVRNEELKLRDYEGSGFATHVYQTWYTYDRDRRLKTVLHPTNLGSGNTSYDYDVAGRLRYVTTPSGSLFENHYDRDGRLAYREFPNGVDTTAYDLDGRVETRKLRVGLTTYMNEAMTYDSRNLVTAMNDPALPESALLDYSGLGHLTESVATHWQGTPTTREWFTSDAFGRGLVHDELPDIDLLRYESGYEEAEGGKLREATERWARTDPIQEPVDWEPGIRYYTYDNNGNRDRTSDLSHSWELAPNGGGYATKQVTWRDESKSFYSADDRLMFMQVNRDSIDYTNSSHPEEGPWGVFEEYWYDALGRRVLKRSRQDSPHCEIVARCLSSIERFVWSGDQLLWEVRDTNPVNLDTPSPQPGQQTGTVGYVHAGGTDAPLAMIRNGQTIALHQNWRGLYAFGTKPDGSLATCTPVPFGGCEDIPWPAGHTTSYLETQAVEYYPWYGSLISSHADATGMLYRRNRYYDPVSGQFTQVDPIGIAGGLNLYGYANGDPINFSDPFGLSECEYPGKDAEYDALTEWAECKVRETAKEEADKAAQESQEAQQKVQGEECRAATAEAFAWGLVDVALAASYAYGTRLVLGGALQLGIGATEAGLLAGGTQALGYGRVLTGASSVFTGLGMVGQAASPTPGVDMMPGKNLHRFLSGGGMSACQAR